MRRTRLGWTLVGISLGWLAAFVAPVTASASGGGGCGEPVTDDAASEVTISDFCFSPTIARIEPGATVTFRNADPFPHTVLGANAIWGSFEALRRGDEVTYRLERPGVYPYVCTYHPGMVGAIVVGSGDGPGAAGLTTTRGGPVTRVLGERATPGTPASEPATTGPSSEPASTTAPTSGSPWPIIAAIALGALALSVAVGRTRRRSRV
jgi:plastocyanin